MRKRIALWVILAMALIWIVLTLWVQFAGPQVLFEVGERGAKRTALIVYNPDPLYDLDQQVSRAFAEGLAEEGFFTRVATTQRADDAVRSHDLYVFCANTYNWAPDWKTVTFINGHPELSGKDAVAITLGAGSTGRSQRLLEKHLIQNGMHLLGSRAFWLLRPNDESRMDEKNVDVVVDLAHAFGREIGSRLSGKVRTPAK